MIKKYFVALTMAASMVLLVIATTVYPGGSEFDKNAVGYNWGKNYICNLFAPKAMNGADNLSMPWAIVGMWFTCISFGVFYYGFSKRIPSKSAANVIKYAGLGSAFFAFFIVTSYHDIMVTITDTLSMISMFYITVFVFKANLPFHKILCCLCLLALYFLTYIYYSRSLPHFLPAMQKISFAISITWMLCLQYFTKADSFKSLKAPTVGNL